MLMGSNTLLNAIQTAASKWTCGDVGNGSGEAGIGEAVVGEAGEDIGEESGEES